MAKADARYRATERGAADTYKSHRRGCPACKAQMDFYNALARAMDERLPIFRKDE